jgi:hypothetical protein
MANTMHFRTGDQVEVKLSDADWQPATVVTREVTGFGTPAKRVTFYVKTRNGLHVTVTESQVR